MSGDELTDNEPTERYWRHVDYPDVIEGTTQARHATYERQVQWAEVVVMTPAELAAIKAEAYDEGVRRTLRYAGMPADTWWRNPYTESEE